MVFRDSTILIQNMFGIAPKSFDSIDMVFGLSATDKFLGMVNRMMFAITFQGLVAPKRIGEIDRFLSSLRLNMFHKFLSTDRLHDFGIDALVPLQKPKDDAFAGSRSTTFALAPKFL